jgi:plasmid stabilization system protein ParE
MYNVLMRQTAHDSLREVISYVSTDNPTAAEKLGNELVDQALSLESLPFRGVFLDQSFTNCCRTDEFDPFA